MVVVDLIHMSWVDEPTKKGKYYFICRYCREGFRSNKRNRRFCNKDSLKKLFTGRDYIREIVRIRDNHICQQCGKRWKEGERRLDVHHLYGLCGQRSRSYDSNKETDNLITLCHRCHLNLPEVLEKMKNHSSPRIK